MNLLDYIPTGAENAINTKTLLQDSGLRSVRALRKEIHRLRERGHIICASTDPPTGYYIAADRQEAARFVRSMESRRREIGRAIKAAKKNGVVCVYWDNGYNGNKGFGIINRFDYTITQPDLIAGMMRAINSTDDYEIPSPAGYTEVRKSAKASLVFHTQIC